MEWLIFSDQLSFYTTHNTTYSVISDSRETHTSFCRKHNMANTCNEMSLETDLMVLTTCFDAKRNRKVSNGTNSELLEQICTNISNIKVYINSNLKLPCWRFGEYNHPLYFNIMSSNNKTELPCKCDQHSRLCELSSLVINTLGCHSVSCVWR